MAKAAADGGIILKMLRNERVIQHSQQHPLSSTLRGTAFH